MLDKFWEQLAAYKKDELDILEKEMNKNKDEEELDENLINNVDSS